MSSDNQSTPEAKGVEPASKVLDAIRVDFNTIRIIVLTAGVVVVLLSVPLVLLLRNFVTFDTLDSYLKATESVRPKILHAISEELDTGYSKNFIFDSPRADNTMLFYASKNQRVTLSADAVPIGGVFQPVMLQLNGCNIGVQRTETLHLYEYDLTKEIGQCAPDEPNLHTLRIVLPNGLTKGTTLQVKCLVVVYQRVYEHLGATK